MIKKPAKSKLPVLTQLCKLIPPHLVSKIARKHGIDKQARTFTPWSHVVSLLFAQLTHSIGLNDVCDTLRIHSRWLGSLRAAVAPTRNTLSHANKTRNSDMMQELFWEVLGGLENQMPGGFGLKYKGLPRRFKKANQLYAPTLKKVKLPYLIKHTSTLGIFMIFRSERFFGSPELRRT